MTINITQNVTGDEQESNFQNACQSIHGMHSISIAVRSPDGVEALSQHELEQKLRADFAHLAEQGYRIDVQMGRD